MATNKLKFGTETPTKLYMGDSEVTKAYMDETLVYEKSTSSGETWLLNEIINNATKDNIYNEMTRSLGTLSDQQVIILYILSL